MFLVVVLLKVFIPLRVEGSGFSAIESCDAKTGLQIFVAVIPKEGLKWIPP